MSICTAVRLFWLLYCMTKKRRRFRTDSYRSTAWEITDFLGACWAHHHHGRAPDWNVAVSTSCFHRPRSWASRQAEFRPWLSGWRFASKVRSQVRRGRPGRRLQSLGNPRIDVYRALGVSCESPIRATCPKKRSRLSISTYQFQKRRRNTWNKW